MTVFNFRSHSIAASFIVSLIVMLSSQQLLGADDSSLPLNTATFDQSGALIKPKDLDRWIHIGTNMGQGYNEELFDPEKPGTFQIVEIEPAAYDYFKQYGRYADGTMIALSFYKATDKASPKLNGFHQGDLVSFEIHLIDSQKYKEGRAFFNFGMKEKAEKIAEGSRCVECHEAEGAFESTFTQFYPKMQSLLLKHQQ